MTKDIKIKNSDLKQIISIEKLLEEKNEYGENIKVVSQRLGHSDIRMTLNTYTHIVDDMNKNTAQLLDKMFG